MTLLEIDLKKSELLKEVTQLVATKKKLYANVDIESPMGIEEKALDKAISNLYSDINDLNKQKRNLIK